MNRPIWQHRPGLGLVLAVAIGPVVSSAEAQSDRYPEMAAIEEYLMESDAEILLARSAAPESISGDATVLVLGRRGYEIAIEGRNGFHCMVARGWMAAFDWPEFWNPKIRAADCMNLQASRFVVPLAMLRSRMVMQGSSRDEILAAIESAYQNGELPDLESGAMDYMMSRSSYLTDEGDHNAPHLMFFTVGIDVAGWGSGAAGAPLMSAPYWFFSSEAPSGLPPVLVTLIAVPNWSDGTQAGDH